MFELICSCVHRYPLRVNIIKVTFRLTNHHRRLWALSIHRRDGERKIWHVTFARYTVIMSTLRDGSDSSPRNKLSNKATQQKINTTLMLLLPAADVSLRSRWLDYFLTHYCFQTDLSHSARLWHRPACPELETVHESVRGHGNTFIYLF